MFESVSQLSNAFQAASIARQDDWNTVAAGINVPQLCGMLEGQISASVTAAATCLQREDGMPGFVADQLRNTADMIRVGGGDPRPTPSVCGGDPRPVQLMCGGGDPRPMPPIDHNFPSYPPTEHCGNSFEDAFRRFGDELTKSIVDAVRTELKNTGGTDGEGAQCGKTTGGSWMQAIARAMGDVLGSKASRMVELSHEIQALSGAKTAPAPGATQADENTRNMEAASKSQQLNTEFQATGQEFNLLQTTFSTAMKTLGEGMASVARKQ